VQSGDIAAEVDLHALRTTLKRIDPEAEKALRKSLGKLGTIAKTQVQAQTPVKTGRLKASMKKKSSFTGTRSQVAVTSEYRYAFIVNYGRQKYAPFPGRHYIQRTMETLRPMAEAEMERIKREALSAFH